MFARAREKARQASCQSNLKQIALAELMYAQDYDERLARRNSGANCNAALRTNGLAMHVLLPYIKNTQVYLCPSRPTPPGYCGNCSAASLAQLPRSSYNANCRRGDPALAEIRRPAEMFLVGESAGGNFWRPHTDWTGCDCGVLDHHNGGINVAYVDGHVKWLKAEKAHATRAVTANYLPWSNKEVYPPGY